jgi:hypothetical protein
MLKGSFVLALSGIGIMCVAACKGSSSNCTTGTSIECACAQSGKGAQVCQANGTYGPCECAPATTAAPAATTPSAASSAPMGTAAKPVAGEPPAEPGSEEDIEGEAALHEAEQANRNPMEACPDLLNLVADCYEDAPDLLNDIPPKYALKAEDLDQLSKDSMMENKKLWKDTCARFVGSVPPNQFKVIAKVYRDAMSKSAGDTCVPIRAAFKKYK